jgi:hypothetical protein
MHVLKSAVSAEIIIKVCSLKKVRVHMVEKWNAYRLLVGKPEGKRPL